MTLIVGLVLTAISIAAFSASLPRGGKTARFVGTEWEGYAVVLMVALFGIGIIVAILGTAALIRGA